ncbi:MAG: sugar phosphate isomerase/epimerase [Armatimonadetes bacterium]|nr:sugar phosphate isomerase/epimerase [Armatimonadota bacterium]
MRPKMACADFTFPLLAHDKVMQLIALLEFQGVDIGLFEERSHLWPSQEFEEVEVSARNLKRELEGLGMEVADVFLQMAPDFTPYALNHPEESRRRHARDWFERTLDYASGAGARHVTTLPGVHFEEESWDSSFHRSVEELAWRVDRAKAHGLVFSIEAHVGSIVPAPDLAAKLVTSVPGLTLTLDYTHFARLGMSDEEVEPLIQHASHFHVRGACKGRLQAPFKDNIIDYTRVCEVMGQTGYTGWIGIEYVWFDWEHCNECDNLSETLLFRDHLRTITGGGDTVFPEGG